MTTTCKHQKTMRVPSFPGDCLVCADCGQEMLPVGYVQGVRDYYVPGDPTWRRQSELAKVGWLAGGEDLTQCPACCFVGTLDDFDVMGADYGNLFCNQCGVEFGDTDLVQTGRQRDLFPLTSNGSE